MLLPSLAYKHTEQWPNTLQELCAKINLVFHQIEQKNHAPTRRSYLQNTFVSLENKELPQNEVKDVLQCDLPLSGEVASANCL